MAERSFKEEVKTLGSARARSSAARASSPSRRRCCSRASPTSPATRARRSRTSWTCSPTPTTSWRSSASTSSRAPARRPRRRRSRPPSTIPCAAPSPSSRPVGTNVASDALANLASGGVNGGAMLIVGEDYGEGSSIMQERSHAFAMKSQVWLLDPRPNLPTIVDMVEKGFELSEASNTPVMLEVRIRACHVYGAFRTKDNVRPAFTPEGRPREPGAGREPHRAAAGELPAREGEDREALARRGEVRRGERAQRVLRGRGRRHRHRHAGRHVQHGVVRALELLGLADSFGNTRVPLYVLNVTYPLDRRRVRRASAPARRRSSSSRRGSRSSSSRPSTPSCAGPTSRPASTARTCCRWPASTPAR